VLDWKVVLVLELRQAQVLALVPQLEQATQQEQPLQSFHCDRCNQVHLRELYDLQVLFPEVHQC
jgi:hypothetical protein